MRFSMNIKTVILKCFNKAALLCAFAILCSSVYAQQTTVLPGNGSSSQNASPQGGLRYQRGFYLITPKELLNSGLTSGMSISSIGFTLGASQSITTKGGFKVYLQNTTDTISRVDTVWTTVAVTGNSLNIPSGLFAGNYEWQVRALCTSNSPYSGSNNFSNENLTGCNSPTNLFTTNIKTDSATFNWTAPSSSVTKYYVEYKNSDSANWIKDSSTVLFFKAGNLVPNKNYQWRVRSSCASAGSPFVTVAFITNAISSCGSPTGLTSSSITNTSAQVSWNAVTGASYYFVQYRRAGTINWFTSLSSSNTFNITANLVAGTSYEWQVRTTCAAGTGNYIAGTNFTTTGTTVCYAPDNLSVNAVTDSSALLKWSAASGAASYEVRYRLKETITWANAIIGTTQVHNDSLLIPSTAGRYNIPFAGGSSFNYTGNGVYVAWEYSRSAGMLSTNNVTIATTANTVLKGANGVDSIKYLLSFITRSDTAATALQPRLVSTNIRPETRLGSASLTDSVEVVALYALGKTAPRFQTPSPVSARINNKNTNSKTFNALLNVTSLSGAPRYTETLAVTVAGNDTALVTFTGWSPTVTEKVMLTVSIAPQPGENVVNNNRKSYQQSVTSNTIGYEDASASVASAGYNAGSGLLLNKHNIKGCGKVIAAQIYLSASAKGHAVNALVLNSAGTIVAQSASFTPDSTETNTYHSFYFNTPPSFLNEVFYIGLAQTVSGNAYNPVGIQWEDAIPRAGAYYRANLTGGSLIDSAAQGRLMIRAEVISSTPEPFISGNTVLCTGSTITLTAGSTDTRFASSVNEFSTQNSNVGFSAIQALGTPNVFPAYTVSGDSWVSSTADSRREFLVLTFPNAAPINYVDIFETSNPGAVDTIFVRNPSTLNYDVVYTATASAAPQAARKNHISFPRTIYNVSEIRIALNSPAVSGYNTIDAVGIGDAIVPATFNTYLWTGGQTTQTKSVTTPNTYSLTVTNANGCSYTDSIKIVATNSTAPVITNNRPLTFCAGDSVILSSNRSTGNVWSTGATTASITVKTSGPFTVSNNDGAGCGSLTSSVVTTVVNPLPTVTISGTHLICPGSTVVLDAGTGFTTYNWSTGATSQTINVNSEGNFTVTVTNGNGCAKSASFATTLATLPAPVITGTVQFCPGSSTILDAGSYETYLWSTGATSRTINVNTAGNFSVSVSNLAGCTGSTSVTTGFLTSPVPMISGIDAVCPGGTVTLTANSGYTDYLWSTGSVSQSINASTGTYSVTVTALNGCTASVSKVITQASVPAPVISGTLSFCGSSSTTLDAGEGYNSYLWTNGSASHSILVTTAGSFTVTVTNNYGCSGSASVTTTTQGSVPATPGPISGSAGGVCNSTGNTYSIAPVTNATLYVWTVPAGATITSGQNNTSITVSYGPSFTSGNIIVAASNACGQSPSNTPRVLAVTGIAAVPGAISGQTSGLCNSTGKVYSITAVNGASSYTWTVPTGVTITTGQGTTSITVNFSSNFSSGSICVKANSTCGSSAVNCLTVSGTASITGTISGLQSVCSKQKNVVYTISAAPGATSYTWTVPPQATIVSGQGTTTITVNYSNKNGTVTVKPVNACGSGVVISIPVTIVSCNRGGEEAEITKVEAINNELVVFPNPSKGIVNIQMNDALKGKYTISVSDAFGQTVLTRSVEWNKNNIVLDLTRLSNAVYYITIYNEHYKKVTKLVKM